MDHEEQVSPSEPSESKPKSKVKAKKAPEWKSLPDAEKAQYLLDHQTLSDRNWTGPAAAQGRERAPPSSAGSCGARLARPPGPSTPTRPSAPTRRQLKQEFQRHQRPPKHQLLSSLRPWEFAESSGSSPGTASSSTCVARCPSATASGAVGTSSRYRRVPTGCRRPTTIRDSKCTEVASRPTTSGSGIGSATNVTTYGV